MPEVRHARDHRPARRQQRPRVFEHAFRLAHVFEHIRGNDDVELAGDRAVDARVEVGEHELVDALAHALGFGHIDAGDPMSVLAQLGRELTARAPEVEDAPGRAGRDPIAQRVMRRELAFLHFVVLRHERGVAGAEADLVHAVAGYRSRDIARVPEAVDVTDLVAVIRRDRDLDDALSRPRRAE